MKWFSVFLILLSAWSTALADENEQYARIYAIIEEADTLNTTDKPKQALEKYQEAQTALAQFQQSNPSWNADVVRFRMNDVAAKITTLSGKAAEEKTQGRTPQRPGTTPATGAKPAAQPELVNQLNSLKEQFNQLQGEKVALEAKLKEALAVQPASVDPAQLSKAMEQIKALEKQNELLSASLTEEKSKPAPAVDTKALDQAKDNLAEANRKLTEQANRLNDLAAEKASLEKRLQSPPPPQVDKQGTEKAEKALAEANRKLKDQGTQLALLEKEKSSLEKRLKENSSGPDKKALDQAREALTDANRKYAEQTKQLDTLKDEKTTLEKRLKQAQVAAQAAEKSGKAETETAKRIKQLETDREELQKKLETANKEASARKSSKAGTAKVENLESQIAALRAKLQTYEAKPVPYSSEELALLKAPPVQLTAAEAAPKKKANQELPAGVKELLMEAQKAFSTRQLDKAEEKYVEALRQADQNIYILGNLAAIQLERNKLDEAEKNIKRALEISPDDAYSLSILGRLKFRQQKYDDAIESLSRAAQLDPQNAEVQNYLGIALSQKGMRGPAETALRKAVQLQPSYGEAHHNLAVAYASQQPPLLELAKWHYQKSIATGSPRSAELEKMLQQNKN